MGTDPLVSVIIAAYNGEAYIREAVESALRQTYTAREVIVVDDGSDSPAAAALEDLTDRITVIRQENRGVAAARNRGIRASRGELIALLDQDDVWLPHKLERQVEALMREPDACLVHADVTCLDAASARLSRRMRPRAAFAGRCYGRLFLGSAISSCTVVMRRACADAVDLFDETIRGTDDYDLELRLARRFPFWYVDEPLAVYRVHGANWSHRKLEMRRNELRVLEKTLEADPALRDAVGPQLVDRRLAALLFEIGYALFDAGDYAAARPYFRRAALHRPEWASTSLALTTLLPSAVIPGLRAAKRQLRFGRKHA